MVFDCLSLLRDEKTIVEINQFRIDYFWNNNFIHTHEKLNRIVTTYVYLQWCLWFTAITTNIGVWTSNYFPQILYANSSIFMKILLRLFAYFCFTFGYYVALTHESYYVYIILHGYLQIYTLKAYLQQEFRRYENFDLNTQINSYRYQSLIEGVFLRCIKQHKIIAT